MLSNWIGFPVAGYDNPTEYIKHHLSHKGLQIGDGSFWTLHLDTLITSGFLGLLAVFGFWLAVRRVSVEAPGKWQSFVEIVIEFIDGQVKDVYHGKRHFVGPIAITIFIWVLLMNSMDLIPIDFIALFMKTVFGMDYWRPVATADLNMTFALSLTVLFLMLFFALRSKGIGGLLHEFFTAPFGPWLAPANFALNLVEWLSKPVSLAMRLFGNMYGGEIVFLLIWLLGSVGLVGAVASGVFGWAWGVFHILIILLQAFIFMILSVVYFAMVEEHH